MSKPNTPTCGSAYEPVGMPKPKLVVVKGSKNPYEPVKMVRVWEKPK